MDTNIEDSTDLDFIFTDTTLETQFINWGDNIKMIYDRESYSMKGQFDIAGTTHICKPFTLPEATDTFANNECYDNSGVITDCSATGTEYAISYECNDRIYSYIFKRCVPVFPPIVLTSSTTPLDPRTNQPLIWKVTATG